MIRFGGIASGLDTQNIIKELMNAERMPMNRIFQKREWTVWQRDAYREVNLAVSKFRDNFEKLRMQTTFNALTANSGNTGIATATANGNAVPGSYTVNVEAMPEAAKVISKTILKDDSDITSKVKASDNVFDLIGRDRESEDAADFAIKIEVDDGEEFILTISKTDTFQSLAAKISNLSRTDDEGKQVSAGLRASFDDTTGTLMISSREMGKDKKIKVTNQAVVSGDQADAQKLWNKLFTNEGQAEGEGADGKVKVGDFTIEDLSSNKVSVHGINLTFHQVGTTTVTIGSDPDQVFDTIKGFVEAYNELIADLQSRVDERRNRDYPPLTTEERNALSEKEVELWDENAKKGLLASDPIIRSLLSEMRQLISTPVEGISGGKMSLAQIGIATTDDWRAGGKLAINEDKLRAAITNNPDEVMQLFTKRADEDGDKKTMGIGDRLFGLNGPISNSIKSLRDKAGSPGNNSDTQSVLAKSLKEVNDQLTNWERRLADIEDRYWRQFTAMEKALQQMNNQSAWIMANMFGGAGGQ